MELIEYDTERRLKFCEQMIFLMIGQLLQMEKCIIKSVDTGPQEIHTGSSKRIPM